MDDIKIIEPMEYIRMMVYRCYRPTVEQIAGGLESYFRVDKEELGFIHGDLSERIFFGLSSPHEVWEIKDIATRKMLNEGLEMLPIIKRHIEGYLDGKRQPKKTTGSQIRRDSMLAEIVSALTVSYQIKATRNEATDDRVSACELTSAYFIDSNETSISYETVAKAWKSNRSLRECNIAEALKTKAELEAAGYILRR